MLANILVIAILVVWAIVAVSFVFKTAKESVANQHPGCVGCAQGCSPNGPKHCKH